MTRPNRYRALRLVMFNGRPHVLLEIYPEAKAMLIRSPGHPETEQIVREAETQPYLLEPPWDLMDWEDEHLKNEKLWGRPC